MIDNGILKKRDFNKARDGLGFSRNHTQGDLYKREHNKKCFIS